jgi:hypothetical protein
MGITVLFEALVKYENRDEYLGLLKERQKFFDQLEEVKSVKIYQQTFGGVADTYVELWEMDNMGDIDSFLMKAYGMDGFPELAAKIHGMIEPGSLERRIWTEVIDFVRDIK